MNILFSYVPLLMGAAGVAHLGEDAIRAAEELAGFMETLPSGAAEACLWMMDETGKVSAVFAMKQHADIAAHLKLWAEGKPEKWFSLHFLEKGQSYALALIPDIRMSAERWKIAFQLRHGFPPIEGSESYIFRPLHCVAKTKVAFNQVKKHLKQPVRVGLIAEGSFTPQNYQVTEDQISWLGEFRVVEEQKSKKGMAAGYLESSIDEMLKEGT